MVARRRGKHALGRVGNSPATLRGNRGVSGGSDGRRWRFVALALPCFVAGYALTAQVAPRMFVPEAQQHRHISGQLTLERRAADSPGASVRHRAGPLRVTSPRSERHGNHGTPVPYPTATQTPTPWPTFTQTPTPWPTPTQTSSPAPAPTQTPTPEPTP